METVWFYHLFKDFPAEIGSIKEASWWEANALFHNTLDLTGSVAADQSCVSCKSFKSYLCQGHAVSKTVTVVLPPSPRRGLNRFETLLTF